MSWQCCSDAPPSKQLACIRSCCRGHRSCRLPVCPRIHQKLSCLYPADVCPTSRILRSRLRQAVPQRAARTSLCCLLLRGCGLQQPAVLDRPPRIVQQGLPLEPASRQLRGNLAKACSRTMQAGKYARRRVSPSCLDLALLLLQGYCLLLRAPWLLNVASVWPALPASS